MTRAPPFAAAQGNALRLWLRLCHGSKDLLRKLDEAEAAKNVRALVQLAKTRGIAWVLSDTPKPEILFNNELKSDLVHPNAKGYAQLAQAVTDLLKTSGAL